MPKTAHVAVAAAGVFVVFATWILLGPRPEAVRSVDNLLFVALCLLGLALAVLAAARAPHGRLRAAWVLMGVAMAGWLTGAVLVPYYEMSRGFPAPSLADAAYLAFVPAACAALLLLTSPGAGRGPTRLVLDGVVVSASLFTISWLTVMGPIYRTLGLSQSELVVSLAYPIADVALLTVAVIVFARVRVELRIPAGLLSAAFLCLAAADSLFVYAPDIPPEYADILNFAAMLLVVVALAAAVHVPLGDPDDTPAVLPGWVSLLLPYAPLLIAVGFLVSAPSGAALQPPLLIAVVVLVAVVLVRQFLEVRANRRILADVAEQGVVDPLTGLANRARFNDRLVRALRRHQDDGAAAALIVMDLDDFKSVNDHLGHQAGDELLRHAADRIERCVRAGDTVARIGGDEFAILIDGGLDGAYLAAERVLDAFGTRFRVDGSDLWIRPSLGLAVADQATGPLSADALLTRADAAMYAAKRSRSGGIHVYSDETDLDSSSRGDQFVRARPAPGRSDATESIALLVEFRRAVDEAELDLVYQPIVDLSTHRIAAVEALLRWPHPTRGVLGPDTFLPLVRRHGLMSSITDLVVDRALDDAAAWSAAGVGVPVAINIFAPLLDDLSLPGRLERELTSRGLDGTALTLEITEDQFLAERQRARTVLDSLHRQGIRIAIDDFGTGYSALSYLRDLHVDEVKLDHGFVGSMTAEPRAAAIVRAVIDLAHDIGLIVVAEGVEDSATEDLLRRLGCDFAQGYHLGAPVQVTELRTLLGAPARG